ncbi:MAG: UvrD-helicase domain-containing protein, partial [Nitrospiria bacterium]
IGTIHHFAASLLRLYPLQADVDPLFQIDEDGRRAAELFKTCWRDWLNKELAPNSLRAPAWRRAFDRHTMGELEATAKILISEAAPLSALQNKTRSQAVPPPVRHWLKSLEDMAETLLSAHPENRKIEKMLRAALTLFQAARERGDIPENAFEAERAQLSGNKPSRVKGWEKPDFKDAECLINIAKQLLQVDHQAVAHLLQLLAPFITRFHERARREGLMTFDALLAKTRDLLRDHPVIREALKHRYRAILIDEFQDTDPVQYEILLYLAEAPGGQAKDWRDVSLSPGKLFVVGDPKQSIYGFRRADIEAYHAVREMILQQNGVHCTLKTNFRSHKKILDTVNGVLSPLIRPKSGLQPEYIPIAPAPEKRSLAENPADSRPFRAVSFQCVRSEGSAMNAETAKQREGEAITRWLSETVLGKAEIMDAGLPRKVKQGDVAILMRSLTGVHHILAPLRRAGIRYLVEGERHFYRNPVVNDAVNLLRAVADPHDRVALTGLLRAPLGGLTDAEILALHANNQLDYRRLSSGKASLPPVVEALHTLLNRLHDEAARLPAGLAVSRIFEATPLKLLAAATVDGEQALANLAKLEQEAARLACEEDLSFRSVVDVFKCAVLEDREEAESPLAEEGLDAVQVLSIHKAKGLEFPVVVLAGCQSGPPPGERETAVLRHDWSTHLRGLRVGDTRDLVSVFLSEKNRLREGEEEKRILYVAMTRAREHLMFSAALNGRIPPGSLLAHLQTAAGENGAALVDEHSGPVPMGDGVIEKRVRTEVVIDPPPPQVGKRPEALIHFEPVARQWAARFETYDTIQNTPVFISPTRLKTDARIPFKKDESSKETTGLSETGVFIGRCAHRFLETWDFSSDVQTFSDKLRDFMSPRILSKTSLSRDAILQEMEGIFRVFFDSEPYHELASAKILGREVPFLIPWEGKVLEGVIDLLYEKDGALFIADYKTDRIQKEDLPQAA